MDGCNFCLKDSTAVDNFGLTAKHPDPPWNLLEFVLPLRILGDISPKSLDRVESESIEYLTQHITFDIHPMTTVIESIIWGIQVHPSASKHMRYILRYTIWYIYDTIWYYVELYDTLWSMCACILVSTEKQNSTHSSQSIVLACCQSGVRDIAWTSNQLSTRTTWLCVSSWRQSLGLDYIRLQSQQQ